MAGMAARKPDDDLAGRLHRRAEAMSIIGNPGCGDPEFTFDELAAAMRHVTARRNHTPAEILLREARDER
jgi:hypothetical protein